MKKKMAALCAAMVMTFGCLVLPAQAEETKYQKGDINMDGKVDCVDALYAMENYTRTLCYYPPILTEEQIELGNVDGEISVSSEKTGSIESAVDVVDALIIMNNYVRRLAGITETVDETYAWMKDPNKIPYEIDKDAHDQFQQELLDTTEDFANGVYD